MLRSAFLAAVAVLALPATGLAADWSPAQTVKTVPWVSGVHAGLGPDGSVALGWDGNSTFTLADRLPGGAFRFSPPVESWYGDIDADDAGAMTVAMARGDAVEVRTRPPGGVFGEAEPLSDVGTEPFVDVSPNGTTIVAWRSSGGIDARIRPAGGAFGPVLAVTDDPPEAAQVAIADTGEAIVTWQYRSRVRVKIRPAGGEFPTEPADLGDAREPSLAMNARGDAQISFVHYDESADRTFAGAHRGPGEPFQIDADVSGVLDSSGPSAAAVGPDGAGLVAWSQDGVPTTVARRAGTYGSPVPVAAAGAGLMLAATDAAGDDIVAWEQYDEQADTLTLQVARRASGAAAFGEPKPISGASRWVDKPVLRTNGDGDALLAWAHEGEDDSDIQLSLWEADDPAPDAPKDEPVPGDPAPTGAPAAPAAPAAGPVAAVPAAPRAVPGRKAGRLVALTARRRRGRALVAFRLDAPARVTLALQRRARGRGKRVRWTATGRRRTVSGRAGVNSVSLGLRGLRSGRYRVVASIAGGGVRTAPLKVGR